MLVCVRLKQNYFLKSDKEIKNKKTLCAGCRKSLFETLNSLNTDTIDVAEVVVEIQRLSGSQRKWMCQLKFTTCTERSWNQLTMKVVGQKS